MSDNKKLYKYHTINLKALESALTHNSLYAKQGIRENNERRILLFCRMYALILGAWSEVRLLKILHEVGGFPKTLKKKL